MVPVIGFLPPPGEDGGEGVPTLISGFSLASSWPLWAFAGVSLWMGSISLSPKLSYMSIPVPSLFSRCSHSDQLGYSLPTVLNLYIHLYRVCVCVYSSNRENIHYFSRALLCLIFSTFMVFYCPCCFPHTNTSYPHPL